MTRALIPTLIAASLVSGCVVCGIDPGPPHRNHGLKSGHWAFDIQPGRVQGGRACVELGITAEAISLDGFVSQRRGELIIDLDGIELHGRQEGAEVFAVGALDIAVSVETDERPAPGTDAEDDGEGSRESDTDCEEVGDEDSGDPPPCDVPEEDEGEDEGRPPHGDSEEEPAPGHQEGVLIELSAFADGPFWMSGDLIVDYVAGGRVLCSLRAPFDAWHLEDRGGYAMP